MADVDTADNGKSKTSFALTRQALDILKRLARSLGISMSAVLEILIREKEKDLP